MGQEAYPLSWRWLSTSYNLSVCSKRLRYLNYQSSRKLVLWNITRTEEKRTKRPEQLKESQADPGTKGWIFYLQKNLGSSLAEPLSLCLWLLPLLRVAIIVSKDGHNSISQLTWSSAMWLRHSAIKMWSPTHPRWIWASLWLESNQQNDARWTLLPGILGMLALGKSSHHVSCPTTLRPPHRGGHM